MIRNMSISELKELLTIEKNKYDNFVKQKYMLDLTRGKPSPEQLDLSNDILDAMNSKSEFISEEGIDIRNYGGQIGIKEARKLMADMINVDYENVIVAGSSSMELMFLTLTKGMLHGFDGQKPWNQVENRKFLCPVPGYDRHFAIAEHFGFELINIPMLEDGPDMDLIEELVKNDETIKGIWCVPKYSNPSGVTYSDEVVKRFANLKPKAKDFKIIWDNAYSIHGFYEDDEILDIILECDKAGNPNMVFEFCSTSKIAFPGSGLAAIASSLENITDFTYFYEFVTIGPDKVNQMRYFNYFKNIDGIKMHMKKLVNILLPKFEKALEILEKNLGDLGIASWTKPKGGYFISFDTMEGLAPKVVEMAEKAGLKLLPTGSTYPYFKDPKESNIRIAPSYLNMDNLIIAMEIFTNIIKIVSIEKIIQNNLIRR
ncbi:MAG: aminotransferase class I/II-fold pyridoxal phosphate-dependent enzyme [Tissierellia bacterium]|nr:aminotransferase class I/II-fold pyridoxal phosphate-dependent enzyme [Tissierellia bacterium]